MLPNHSKVEELYNKRELLLHTIETNTKSISEKNQLIQELEEKKRMFKDNGKNILDEIDYFIIEQFGFYNFFDQNKNYMIKEKINEFYKLYTKNKILENKSTPTLQLSHENN
jgi:mevalonate kinase